MTDSEYYTLIHGVLGAHFPDTLQWLRGLPNNQDVIRTWRCELIDLDFATAKTAIEWIHKHPDDQPKFADRQCWPAFIRRIVERDIRREQLQNRSSTEFRGAWTHVTHDDSVCARAFAEGCAARQAAKAKCVSEGRVGDIETEMREAGERVLDQCFGENTRTEDYAWKP